MHEMSYIVRLVNQAMEQVEKKNPIHVNSVHIEVGEMTGLEPFYLLKYYPIAVKNTRLEGSKLEITEVPVEALCHSCQTLFHPTKEFQYLCPHCGGGQATIQRGREFVLDHIAMEVND